LPSTVPPSAAFGEAGAYARCNSATETDDRIDELTYRLKKCETRRNSELKMKKRGATALFSDDNNKTK